MPSFQPHCCSLFPRPRASSNQSQLQSSKCIIKQKPLDWPHIRTQGSNQSYRFVRFLHFIDLRLLLGRCEVNLHQLGLFHAALGEEGLEVLLFLAQRFLQCLGSRRGRLLFVARRDLGADLQLKNETHVVSDNIRTTPPSKACHVVDQALKHSTDETCHGYTKIHFLLHNFSFTP